MKTLCTLLGFLTGMAGFSQAAQGTGMYLENQFVDLNLSAENRQAFEFRAKEKVLDFCNYIQLISNKEYDEKFRKHSMNTAINLFNSNTCRVADSLTDGKQDPLSVLDYFEAIYQTEYHKISCEATNLRISENLTPIDSFRYSGAITYTRYVKCINEKGEINFAARENRTAGVILSREVKKFGNTEKKIWVVSLCDIL